MVRFFDLLFSTLAIIVLFPFMIPVMLGLKLTGEHYIFYLQPRVGRGGRPFSVFKFATMLKDSPNLAGGFITQKEDPRILPMGNFLRKTKINELPQLLNIFLGQMSVVGPRPLVQRHIELYPEPSRSAILGQRPGLTGLASLVFRDEEGILDRMGGDRKANHDRIIAPYKGELEVYYAKHKSLLMYFALIIFTARALFRPRSRAHLGFFKDLPQAPIELAEFIG